MGVPKKALLVDVSEGLTEDEKYVPFSMPKAKQPKDPAKVAAFIKKNCQPWLAATNNGKDIVYRGIHRPRDPQSFVRRVRKNRRPLHSSKNLHGILNSIITVGGKTANRENSVATSGFARRTNMYGDRTFVVMPIGPFNYTWHIDFGDWAEDFIHTYANSADSHQRELVSYMLDHPETITKEWLDDTYGEFLLKGLRGDDNTLSQAIHNGEELMIKADKMLAIEPEFYVDEVLPLLQKADLKEGTVTHELQAFADQVKDHYGLEDFYLGKIDDNTIYLMSIIVPREKQKQGIGSKVMSDLTRYADERGLTIRLSPATKDPHHGTTSHDRLVRFYKQFGFKQNKGRNKDFSISQSMIRTPQ